MRRCALSSSNSAGDILAITCPAGPTGTRLESQKSSKLVKSTVMRMTPVEFGDYMMADMSKWERVVKEAGIKAQ